MGAWGLGHWLVVLAIVLVVFGTKRFTSGLSGGAKDIGNAIKEFKKGMRDEDKPAAQLGDAARKADEAPASKTVQDEREPR